MTEVFVGMGSNIEPAVHVPEGLAALEKTFGRLEISAIYRCPAVGFDGHEFVNLVVAFEVDSEIADVQWQLRSIEADCGRRQRVRDGSRTMDLDMLLFGETIFNNGDIRVPRADILEYAFVLRPLAEMRPQGKHPTSGRRYADLWASFDATDQPLTEISLGQ